MTNKTNPDDLLSEREVAVILGVQANTLRIWRIKKIQLPFIKISSNCIRYKRSVVEAWLASKEVNVHQTPNPVAV